MIRKARLVAEVAILVGAAGGARLALASDAPQRAPQSNGTAARSSALVRPDAGPAISPPLTSVGLPLTQGECKNLGGKVQTEGECSSGLECTHVDSAGTIHRVCITNTVK